MQIKKIFNKLRAFNLVILTIFCTQFSACSILFLGTAAVAAVTVGAGYTVYQGGKAVVSTAGGVTRKVKGAASGVAFSSGEFKTETNFSVAELAMAGKRVMYGMKFKSIKEEHDALSGKIYAEDRTGSPVNIHIKSIDAKSSSIKIKIGYKGDLASSEIIFDRILTILEESKSQTTSYTNKDQK